MEEYYYKLGSVCRAQYFQRFRSIIALYAIFLNIYQEYAQYFNTLVRFYCIL